MRKSVAIGLLLSMAAGLAACETATPEFTTGLSGKGVLPACFGTTTANCVGGPVVAGTSSGGTSSGGTSSGGTSSGGTSSGGTSSGGSSSGASLTSGDAAIAIENSNYVTPTSGTAHAKLTYSNGTGTATVEVDPNAATTGWPASVTMNEYLAGTNAPPNTDLGGDYQEFREISAADGTDYELQVWTWNNSYAAQFRDNPNGGEADRQAWFYGGANGFAKTTAANMPSGTASYTGKWGGTAETSNFEGDTVLGGNDINRLWMVSGTTNLSADFDAGTVTGMLTTDLWRTLADDTLIEEDDAPTTLTGSIDEDIEINTTITGNTIAGTATYGTTAVQGDNVAHGAFFGPAADELTGAFNVHATYVDPMGGDIPINDDRRGYMDISGVFNGAKGP